MSVDPLGRDAPIGLSGTSFCFSSLETSVGRTCAFTTVFLSTASMRVQSVVVLAPEVVVPGVAVLLPLPPCCVAEEAVVTSTPVLVAGAPLVVAPDDDAGAELPPPRVGNVGRPAVELPVI